MELLVLGVLALTVYLLIRCGAVARAWLSQARYRSYRQLAVRYRGKYESRGLYDPPTVSFTYRGTTVRVGLAPQVPGVVQGPRTRVVARFPAGLPLRLELSPSARPLPTQPPKGTRRVLIGDQEFDRGHVVYANDPEIAVEFLSPAVRWSIGNLERLAPPGGMLVSVNPERLLVQVDQNLGVSSEALALAVRETLLLHDGLKEGVAARRSQGIAITAVGPAGADDAGPPICKVCGEPIDGPAVACSTCKTPHHADCWEFIGSCSIYGCQGKKAVPV